MKLKDKTASELFHAFHSELLITLNKHAPEKLIRINEKRVKNPWMSKGLKNSLIKSKKNVRESPCRPSSLVEIQGIYDNTKKMQKKT